MKNRITSALVVTIVILSSCNSTNDLCVCIEKGSELNEFSNELLMSEFVSEEQESELYQLRNEVDSLCAPFKEMGPKELYELRNACGDYPEP